MGFIKYFRNQSTMSTSNISYTRVKPQWDIWATTCTCKPEREERRGRGREGARGRVHKRAEEEGREGRREGVVCVQCAEI
jgi:hypothetical protein